MKRRSSSSVLPIVLSAAVAACRDAPSAPSAPANGVPPAGEYRLQISEAGTYLACLTISVQPGGAPMDPVPGSISIPVLIAVEGEEMVARPRSGSGRNGGDLRLTFAPAVHGVVTGTIDGRAISADGVSGFSIADGTLSGTASEEWRRASGRIRGRNMGFTSGGTSCGSSDVEWHLSRP